MDASVQMGQDIIAKFNVRNKPLYVKLLWTNDDEHLFHIKVFYEDNTWTGTYSEDIVAKRLTKLDETKEQYTSNVKNCLSGKCNDYVIEFIESPDDVNSASFTWKKRYEGALKLHGVVTVQKDDITVSKDALIDILLEKNVQLNSEVEIAKQSNNNLKQDLELYKHGIKELTENKLLLESTLYGRFIQILNEKKRRIHLLEENRKRCNN